MARRPSLIGTAREALSAATQAPAAPAAPVPPVHQAKPPVHEAKADGRQAAPVAPLATKPVPPMLRTAATIYAEMLGYGREHLRQGLEAGKALGRCRSPAEALAAQARFAQGAAAQYLSESAALMALAARGLGESWAEWQRDLAPKPAAEGGGSE